MITGILKKPQEMPMVIEFEDGLSALQELVEGRIEMPSLFRDVDIVINEEGKLNGSLPNLPICSKKGKLLDVLFGNVVIVAHDRNGNTKSLSPEKIEKYMEILSEGICFL